MAGDPRRSSDVPPVHDGRRAVTLPVGGPPAVGVVAPDIAARSPYRREMLLEVGSIAVWELWRLSAHASRRYAAPRRIGRAADPPPEDLPRDAFAATHSGNFAAILNSGTS